MKFSISILFMVLAVIFNIGCSSSSKIKQPSSFGKLLGYEGCKIFGPLNSENAYAIAKNQDIKLPNQELDAMLNEKSGADVYFFHCVQIDSTNIPSGNLFFGLVKNNILTKKAVEIIEN